jgi:hypothetical protein
MLDATSLDSNEFNLVVNNGISTEADSSIWQSAGSSASLTPQSSLALSSSLEALTINNDTPTSISPLFLFDKQVTITDLTAITNTTVVESNSARLDPLLGTNSNDSLVGESSQSLIVKNTIQTTALVSGTLDTTDATTFENARFRDDYLLTD